MLHVRCGNDIVGKLRAAGVPGEILVWADPLCQGPTRAANGEPWYELRSRFIARSYGGEAGRIAESLRAADEALERHDAADDDEYARRDRALGHRRLRDDDAADDR